MATVQIARSDWQNYFDRAARSLGMKQAEIEISSMALGNQIETNWVPLHGVSYDPKDDVLAVFVEGMEHMISHPQSIFVEEDDIDLKSLEVLGEEDTRHIVRLRNA